MDSPEPRPAIKQNVGDIQPSDSLGAGESEGKRAIQATVVGLVQGVGFRSWVKRRATKLGLWGTVRNLSDGTVWVEAQGTSQELARLVTLLRRGPSGSRVDGVQVKWDSADHDAQDSEGGFEIH